MDPLCGTTLFPLENRYALRSYFRLFGNNFLDDIVVLCLLEHEQSFLYITDKIVHYSILKYDMGLQYECHVYYDEFLIYTVSEYVFRFNPETLCWHQNVGMNDNEFVNTMRNHIRAQLQNAFRRIEIGWGETDFECLQFPLWYTKIKTFQQCCTPKTRRILISYLERVRKGARLCKRANENRVRRAFLVWKEWYFNPQNKGGYVTRLLKYDLVN